MSVFCPSVRPPQPGFRSPGRLRPLGVLLALLLWVGCARSPRRAGSAAANTPGTADAGPTTTGAASAERLGTVHVIGTGQRFVLVQTPTSQPTTTLADGQALVCRGAGNVTATLRVSHERRPPFVVADVAAGEPHVGDEVFIDKAPGRTTVPAVPEATPGASTPAPAPDFRTNPQLPPNR